MPPQEESKITFKGYDPHITQLRTDKGWRVSVEVSQEEYDKIKELPKLQDKILDITFKEEDNA